MKLNKKGYMLVEIIVSFALTFAIMISMINLVLSFKNKNEDIYYEAKYLKDKNLITRNIMDDLKNAVVTEIADNSTGNGKVFDFWVIKDYVPTAYKHVKRRLEIVENSDGTTTIKYGLIDGITGNFEFVTSDVTYYEKTIEPTLEVGKISYDDENGVFSLKVPMNSIYTDESYDINLVTKRVYSLDMNIYIKKDGECESGISEIRDEIEYCKFTQGYPYGNFSDGILKKVLLNAQIQDEEIKNIYNKDGYEGYDDIYRFLEYNSNVNFIKVVSIGSFSDGGVPSSAITSSLGINIMLKSDTAINLYFDNGIFSPKYQKLEICEDLADGDEEICSIKHTSS